MYWLKKMLTSIATVGKTGENAQINGIQPFHKLTFFFLQPHQSALKLCPWYTVQILIYPFAFIYYHPPYSSPNHSKLIIF